MNVYITQGIIGRLYDQALLADYATDTSTQYHINQFELGIIRLLSGSEPQATDHRCRMALRATIIDTLISAGATVPTAAAEALIDRLSKIPISDPVLARRFAPVALTSIAAE